MGQEPETLFLYGDSSAGARSVRAAIYDGPVDFLDFRATAVLLEKIPAAADNDVAFEPVQVASGAWIVDGQGDLAVLTEGVSYLPSGCSDPGCSQTYSGQEPVSLDQMVVRFALRSGLTWSDGTPLTAADSVYSYQVAKSILPRAGNHLPAYTESYQALDDRQVEWRGLPGFRDPGYALNFFSPLPRHAWEAIPVEDLSTNEASGRTPLGWGPYQIDEWTAGDHITLSRNPNYFRAAEGLPYFDRIVYRFTAGGEEALDALLAGECDYVDETAGLGQANERLAGLQEEGTLAVAVEAGTAWELASFGIASLDGSRPAFFQTKEVRQAVATCIDRQRLAGELFLGEPQVPDTYLPPAHPLYDPEVRRYPFDPQQGGSLLEEAGWLDADGDPATPRIAQGAPGIPAGTAFEFNYLVAEDALSQRAAQIVQESLAQCGIRAEVSPGPASELFASGPDGPVFGRRFDMAQYAWVTALEPPCFIYTTTEIPGPYPAFRRAWGGANAGGYSNSEFDQACRQAQLALPGTPEYETAHRRAQAIYAEELPSIPLYLHSKLVAYRPDLCGVQVNPSADSALWNLEAFEMGEDCR
jgi:peptide/nickel transport system substrate-binding protein